jgi:hypothetical protein
MQIHEITKAQLQEGLFDAFKTPEKIAAQAAEKLQAQGYGQRKPLPSVQDSVAAVQKNPAQQQYIKGLVAQWQQTASQDAVTQESKRSSKSKTASKNTNWRQDALKSVGATFAQAPAPRPAPGQMPASVAASKQGKLMLQAYGKPRGGIQDIDEAPQEYTTPGGIVVPGGTKTDNTPGTTPSAPVAPVAGNQYKETFLKWAARNLQTKVPGTSETITLDQLLNNADLKQDLATALTQVVTTAGDAQKNAVAVNNFLTVAVAGVARESQRIKQENNRGSGEPRPVATGQAGQGIVTQQEIQNKLASDVELNARTSEELKKIMQDPASRQALAKLYGVRL